MDRQIFRNIASAERARHRMRKTGRTMSGHRLWTDGEIEAVHRLYPDYRAIMKATGRSYSAVRARAQKLGLAPKRHQWTGAEIARLRRLYPEAPHEVLLDAFPGFSIRHIRWIAHFYGFRRKRKPYKLTGVPAIDQVRARAFELSYFMSDIDAVSGSKTYFQKAGWNHSINHRAIARAITALDGNVVARWNE